VILVAYHKKSMYIKNITALFVVREFAIGLVDTELMRE
jgi:hypothetical protein